MLDAAREAIDQGKILEAIQLLKKILHLSHTNKAALELLSKIYLDCSQYKTCKNLLRFCIKHYPQETIFFRYRGILLCLTGNQKAGTKDLHTALSLDPGNIMVAHLLQAASGDISKNTKPEYVEKLFDSYDHDFETSLTRLQYSGHQNLISYVLQQIGIKFNTILDLGCGTGFVGEQIKENLKYEKIIGIDLSAQMLDKAYEKNIYIELHNMEIIDYLRENHPRNQYDLIVSADVFMYIGDLLELFIGVAQNLTSDGYFAFTVENTSDNTDYSLDITGRFKHSNRYIINTLQKSHLELLCQKSEILRYERGKPVFCCIYIAYVTKV